MQENTAEKIKEETIEVPLEPEKTEKEVWFMDSTRW